MILKNILNNKPWYFALYLIIMVLLIASSILEYRSRYNDLLQLIQDQALMTTGIIAQSVSAQAALTDETMDFDEVIEAGLSDLLLVRGLKYIQISTGDGSDPFYAAREDLYIDESWERTQLEDILYEVNKGDTRLIEAVRPIFYELSIGEVRIGFDAGPFLNLRAEMIYRIVLRLGLLTLLAFIGLMFLLARQNAALLAQEKTRIEDEVYRLERINRMNEKQVAVGELAAGVAHEIRNPLNAIGIVAQRLKREFEPTDDMNEYQSLTQTMTAEIEKINRSLKEFLEYTRPTPLEMKQVDLGALFQEIHELYGPQANEAKVEFSIDIPDIQINADITYIQQAISNLVKNALEACEESSIVHLTARRRDKAVEISVSDTGGGIETEDQKRIFDLYFSTKSTGTGIGLAITHKIIADHGGSIEVESQLNKGSTFTIRLQDNG